LGVSSGIETICPGNGYGSDIGSIRPTVSENGRGEIKKNSDKKGERLDGDTERWRQIIFVREKLKSRSAYGF